MKNPSQSAIAQKAGVARTTVSLVLRGGKGLQQDTIDKVLQAADELGYRRNMLVQGIRTGKSRTIGVMIPPHDSHWSKVIHGIHDELSSKDYAPLFLWSENHHSDFDEAHELQQVQRIIDHRVEGVLLWPYYARLYTQLTQEFASRDLPAVSIDCQFPPEVLMADSVCSDDASGAQQAIEHLLEGEPQHFVHFHGPLNEYWAKTRYEMVKAKLGTHKEIKLHLVETPLTPPFSSIIETSLKKLTGKIAVFACMDSVAAEVHRWARSVDRSIPTELSIVGYGNLEFGEYLDPPLSSVDAKSYDMGRQAAKLLLNRIEEQPLGRNHVLTPTTLMTRASSQQP
jgi:DNA-binding LacI/PurR family transcriptional regulator